jgi:hypothetical protein
MFIKPPATTTESIQFNSIQFIYLTLVLDEIDQRHAWMDEMREYGQLTLQQEQQTKAECSQLLAELKKLDSDIKIGR